MKGSWTERERNREWKGKGRVEKAGYCLDLKFQGQNQHLGIVGKKRKTNLSKRKTMTKRQRENEKRKQDKTKSRGGENKTAK